MLQVHHAHLPNPKHLTESQRSNPYSDLLRCYSVGHGIRNILVLSMVYSQNNSLSFPADHDAILGW